MVSYRQQSQGQTFKRGAIFNARSQRGASTLTKSLCHAWLRNRLTLSLFAELDLRRRRRPNATRGHGNCRTANPSEMIN